MDTFLGPLRGEGGAIYPQVRHPDWGAGPWPCDAPKQREEVWEALEQPMDVGKQPRSICVATMQGET